VQKFDFHLEFHHWKVLASIFKREVNEVQCAIEKEWILKRNQSRRVEYTDGREIRRIHFIPRDPLSALALLVLAVRRDDTQEVQKRPKSLAIGRG